MITTMDRCATMKTMVHRRLPCTYCSKMACRRISKRIQWYRYEPFKRSGFITSIQPNQFFDLPCCNYYYYFEMQAAIHIDDSDSEEQVSEETSDSPSSTKCCGAPRSSSVASYSSSIMETDQRSSIPPSVAHIDRNRDQSIELPPAPFSNSVCSTSSAIVDDVNLPRQHSIECDGNHSSKRSYEAGHLDPVGGIKNQELGGRRNRRTRSHSYDGAMGSDHTWSASGGKSDLSSPFAPNSHHSRKWKHKSGGPASRRNRNIRNDESRPYAQNSRAKRKRSQRSDRDVDRELSLYMHMWKL